MRRSVRDHGQGVLDVGVQLVEGGEIGIDAILEGRRRPGPRPCAASSAAMCAAAACMRTGSVKKCGSSPSSVLGERQQVDGVGRGHHLHAVLLGGVDRVLEPGLEAEPVHHDDVGVAQGHRLLRRRGEVVRVRARRHDHLDLALHRRRARCTTSPRMLVVTTMWPPPSASGCPVVAPQAASARRGARRPRRVLRTVLIVIP